MKLNLMVSHFPWRKCTHPVRNLALTVLAAISVPAYAVNQLTHLTVDYLSNPVGLDSTHPRFGWQMTSDQFNVKQQAYRIQVFDEQKQPVWDSGKVTSDDSLGIVYGAQSLKPSHTYRWQLDVWDNNGNHLTNGAQFQTSLLSHKRDAWGDAKWIGLAPNKLPLFSDYLPIFRLSTDVALDKESRATKVGVVFGANDPRLMDSNKNLNHLNNSENAAYVKVELDTSGLDHGKMSQIKVYRVGYTKADSADKPLYQFDVPQTVINQKNRYQSHTINISSVYGMVDIHLDGDQYQIPKPPLASPFLVPGVNINPMGVGSDYIAFPMLSDVGFALDAGQKAHVHSLMISHYREPANAIVKAEFNQDYRGGFRHWANSTDAQFSANGLTLTAANGALILTHNPSQHSMPMLRTEFALDKPVEKAQLYITARGIYEAYLNGKRLSESYFQPGFTEYDKSQPYQVVDVTSKLAFGENALAVQLAEGWWSGAVGFVGEAWNYFGDRQSLLAKLVITYKDGTVKTINSDPQHWKGFAEGPLVYASLFQGQVVDQSKAQPGWTKPGFDDSAWQKVSEITAHGTTFPSNKQVYSNKIAETLIHSPWPELAPWEQTQYVSLLGNDVNVHQTLQAQSVEEIHPGVFVYDMGQNTAAVPKITINNAVAGQQVTLRYGEMTYPSGDSAPENAGMLMLENIRGANATDTFTLKQGKQILSPRFTYHGYRYLEITGIDKALPLEQVESLALSSVPHLASSLTTSNAKVNQLWRNISWSMKSNFLSIPTDTPARNERMGWNGDIQVFSPAAVYFANMPQFFRKHELNMRDTQDSQGRFSAVSPMSAFGGMLWGSAGLIVPWEAYLQYGDVEALRQHYPAMKRYMDYLASTTPEKAGFLGDWLSPEGAVAGPSTVNDMIWRAYYGYDLNIMAKVANVLGKHKESQDYQLQYQQVKTLFNQRYLDPKTFQSEDNATGEIINTQASYAIPLGIGLIEKGSKGAFAQNLVKHLETEVKDDQGVKRPPYSLMTGFIGTRWILNALSENGHQDVAYKMLLNDRYPSWLYSVDQGATTLWERLNSYTKENGFSGNNSMNSFNHYSFGSVAAWMYRHMLGIQSDEKTPGYQHFVLAPQPDPNMGITYAKGEYQSMYGTIRSHWQVKDGEFDYRFTIPANTSATVVLPAATLSSARLNGKPLATQSSQFAHQTVRFELGSGEYRYQAQYR